MEDAAVPAAGVQAYRTFLLNYQDIPYSSIYKLSSEGKPDNAGADN
jgi:hypothetical protein